jgi:hypothetical protein
MNADAAHAYVELHLQPNVYPTLEAEEVDALMLEAAVPDADDLEPADEGWVPTYSPIGCARAIAAGFDVKLAKLIPRSHEFTTDAQTFRRQQIFDHLEAMQKRWTSKISASTSTTVS